MIDTAKLLPALEKLGKEGVLLTSGKKPNTMVISWGSIGIYWNEAVFIAPVRLSRYTREMIDASGVFSISVPTSDMKEKMSVFGKKSGRDTDKYAESGLLPVKCRNIETSAIQGAALTIECEIVAEMEMDIDTTSEDIRKKWYDDDDFHIMYYGKIVNVY